MARLLVDWLQLHPGLDRVQAHAALAVDAQNFDLGRPYFSANGGDSLTIDRESLDERMTANPPASIAELLALVSAELMEDTGLQVTAQEKRPPEPAPEAEPEPPPP